MTTTSTHTDIRAMEANTFVNGVYSLVNPQIGVTRNNETFLKCLLRDASGEIPGRRWKFDKAELSRINETGFVRVAGTTELYQDKMQFKIEEIRPVEVDEHDLAALLPMTKGDIGGMFDRVRELLGSLEHPAMRALGEAYLGEQDLMASFRRCPAAVSVHHAWIGGLLEHTLQLMELAEMMLPRYPGLNRDLVLMGLFLHDLAKTHELSWEKGFNYTTDGNLVGHVVRGAILLQFMAAKAAKASGRRLPPAALKVLQHIVLSHHTQPEYGAAKVPSTPEAIFVAMLDNLDAKTQMALDAVARDDTGANDAEFTDRVWALETRLYRPDPLAEAAPE